MYNIVILPSEEIKQQTIAWSQKLSAQFSTKFTLEGKIYHPHLTLYQTSFPKENLSKIITKLEEVAKRLQPIQISFEHIKPYVDFIFYHAAASEELQLFHESILEQLTPLRDPAYSTPTDLQHFPEHIARNIAAYGYALAKQDFLPHITVSRCQTQSEALVAAITIPSRKMQMRAESIFLANIDHDGTVTQILREFPLPK